MSTDVDDPRFDFLKSLAEALAPLGQTSGELQDQLYACAARLGLKAEFSVLPTFVQITLDADDGTTKAALIPVAGDRIDLASLASLQQMAVDVGKGRISPEEGRRLVELVARHPARLPLVLSLLAGVLSTFAITVILNGGMREVLAAAPTGLAVGLFYRIALRTQRFRGLLELSSAAFATAFALGLGHLLNEFDASVVVVAAIVQFLPGLRITQGVSELAGGDLVAGTARLAGALMTLLNLGIGVGLVWTLFLRSGAIPDLTPAHGASQYLLVAAAVAAAIAYSVTENAHRRDAGWVLLGVVVAIIGSRLGAWALGPTLGVGVASLLVGLAGNGYSRFFHGPKATITVPGLTVLVPGALGFQGILALVKSGGAGGGQLMLTTVLLAAALVVGLTISESLIPPRTLPESLSGDGRAAVAVGRGRQAKDRMSAPPGAAVK